MSIIKDDDCIIRSDGSLLCFDAQENKIILFKKQVVTGDDVSKAEMMELLKLTHKKRME